MEESKSVIKEKVDRTDRYEAGWKAVSRTLKGAFAVLLTAIIAMLVYFVTAGGYFTVDPQHAVIVMKFGAIEKTYLTGGHWFTPYPVNRWVRVVRSQQSLMVDFLPSETFDGSPQVSLDPGRDAYLLTGDANIVHASWTVRYHIETPETYYKSLATPTDPTAPDGQEKDSYGFSGTRGPQTMLRNLFRQAVIQVTARRQVNDILYQDQGVYAGQVQSRFEELVRQANCGVEVDGVTLERIFPPLKTKGAFDEVAAANNTSSSLINQARQYQVQTENATKAQVTEIRTGAETYTMKMLADIQAESAYFKAISEQYKSNPDTVLMALYTNALTDVFRNQQSKFILGTSGKGRKQVRLLLNPEPKRRAGTEAREEK